MKEVVGVLIVTFVMYGCTSKHHSDYYASRIDDTVMYVGSNHFHFNVFDLPAVSQLPDGSFNYNKLDTTYPDTVKIVRTVKDTLCFFIKRLNMVAFCLSREIQFYRAYDKFKLNDSDRYHFDSTFEDVLPAFYRSAFLFHDDTVLSNTSTISKRGIVTRHEFKGVRSQSTINWR